MTSTAAIAEALRLCPYQTPSFPCLADKRPACPHGFKDATADPGQLKELWRQFPGPLVGVPTGEASGIFVIDIDSARHDEATDWLERWSPYLPETRQHATRSGGWHLLFKHRAGLKNSSSKLAKGVDTRGDGGYVIWWPFHMGLNAPHKIDAEKYPLCDLPDAIHQQLVDRPPKIMLHPGPALGRRVGEPHKKVQGILAAVARAQKGNRNSITYWAACSIRDMIANREIGTTEGAASFRGLHVLSVTIGLPAREAARTIRSAVQ
jgi:hypothetical protein